MKNVVTPDSFSPLIIAQFIGAAPLYCGNKEACKLKVPKAGMLQTTFGNILKATTTCTLAFKAFNCSKKSSLFKFVGCSTGMFWSKAYFFTADCESFCPLPAGLSGAVTTPTTV